MFNFDQILLHFKGEYVYRQLNDCLFCEINLYKSIGGDQERVVTTSYSLLYCDISRVMRDACEAVHPQFAEESVESKRCCIFFDGIYHYFPCRVWAACPTSGLDSNRKLNPNKHKDTDPTTHADFFPNPFPSGKPDASTRTIV